MTAKEYLGQIRTYDKRIERKIDELDRLRSLAVGTSGSGMNPDKITAPDPDPHKMEKCITRYVELENEINEMIDGYVELRDKIINEIHTIGDVRYEEILYLRYVQFRRLEEICCQMRKPNGGYYSYDHILHLHGNALKVFWEKHEEMSKQHSNNRF